MAGWWSRTPRETPAHGRSFEALVLPHLDAGYNLARWLLRNDARAEDAVQESALRALRYFPSLRGDGARAWFLGIVRNTCYTQLGAQGEEQTGWTDDELQALQADGDNAAVEHATSDSDPGRAYDRERERRRVDAAIRALPPPWREVIVLREIEELPYAEIAQIAGVPLGTVMSRLSRARAQLRTALAEVSG